MYDLCCSQSQHYEFSLISVFTYIFLNVWIQGYACSFCYVASFLRKRCRKTKRNYWKTVSATYLRWSMRKKSWKWVCKSIEQVQSFSKPTSADAFHINSFVSNISSQLDSEGVGGCSQKKTRAFIGENWHSPSVGNCYEIFKHVLTPT